MDEMKILTNEIARTVEINSINTKTVINKLDDIQKTIATKLGDIQKTGEISGEYLKSMANKLDGILIEGHKEKMALYKKAIYIGAVVILSLAGGGTLATSLLKSMPV